MRNPLLFLLLSLFFYQTLSFSCTVIPNEAKCIMLTNCTWSTSCTGTYTPTCVPPACYYVDSYSTATAGTENGQIDFPYKNISAAIVKLANTTGTIIIVNYKDNATAESTMLHSFSAGVTTIQYLICFDSLSN